MSSGRSQVSVTAIISDLLLLINSARATDLFLMDQCAKSLRRQFERTWCRTKNPLNRIRLHCQIARCNSLVNKDKSDYYSKLISDNSQDPRKLWHVLRKTLSRVSEVTLPPHKSDKALADQFASFFHNKIKTIYFSVVKTVSSLGNNFFQTFCPLSEIPSPLKAP